MSREVQGAASVAPGGAVMQCAHEHCLLPFVHACQHMREALFVKQTCAGKAGALL